MTPPLLIVFCHLRWDFVRDRPQHLLTRLGDRWQVLYVEEPVYDAGLPWLEERLLDRRLTVLVPHTPVAAPGFDERQLPLLRQLLAGYQRRSRRAVDVAWLYTPMALPLARGLSPTCIVYDCIDDLALFADAPAALRAHEDALLQQASLVMTGGLSLYEARRDRHPHVVCLPSAVDAAHYAAHSGVPSAAHDDAAPSAADLLPQDREPFRQAEALQGGTARPRLGYMGVIDHRLDLALLAHVADAHPEWSLVMAGPVARTDVRALPRRPNILWLGPQPYERLPHLLAGWDLCLMPFALNEATRCLCPSQTLEYLAGGKPVVSTPIHDVSWMYGDLVALAEGGPDFVAACERLLAESGSRRAHRALDMMALVSSSSWDRTAQAVHELLLQALHAARARRADAAARPLAAGASAARVGIG